MSETPVSEQATPRSGSVPGPATPASGAVDTAAGEADQSTVESTVETAARADGAAAAGTGPGDAAKRLEREGDVAADYLEELLDIVDLDGDIDIDVENGRASLAVVAEGGESRRLQRLVGQDGEVLEALQELTRLAVQAATGERSRLMLDVAGFRAGRKAELVSLAKRAVEDVRSSGEPAVLEPMSPFERKVVHDVVADAGLRSESEGDEPARRVVIRPSSD